jgi:hypothetical protein
MTTSCRAVPAGAMGRSGCDYGEIRTPVRLIDEVARLARKIWPVCTAPELASRAEVSVRNAEHWLAGRSGMSAEAFAALLRSDAGLEVLEAAMGDARPDWYAALRRRVREERLEAQLQALAAEMADIKQERARAQKTGR